jgi:hypothetical protein
VAPLQVGFGKAETTDIKVLDVVSKVLVKRKRITREPMRVLEIEAKHLSASVLIGLFHALLIVGSGSGGWKKFVIRCSSVMSGQGLDTSVTVQVMS